MTLYMLFTQLNIFITLYVELFNKIIECFYINFSEYLFLNLFLKVLFRFYFYISIFID